VGSTLTVGITHADTWDTQHYWFNRGYAESYSNMSTPLSSVPASFAKNYTDGYNMALRDHPWNVKRGIELGSLPAHTNDNYKAFYVGIDKGAEGYWAAQGSSNDGSNVLPDIQRSSVQDTSLGIC
jgi:hypothetical protein